MTAYEWFPNCRKVWHTDRQTNHGSTCGNF